MSALRKYLKRKTYKERAQPAERNRLGLLEKHQDYVERAQKHHEQRQELERLQTEAEGRNPDEFHFSMEHERTRRGIPISIDQKVTREEEMELKSRDLRFVNFRIRQETKAVEKLQAKVHLLGNAGNRNRHILFVDDAKTAVKLQEAEYFETPKELLDRRFNRPRHQQLREAPISADREEDGEQDTEELNERRAETYEELNAHLETLEMLKALANELWLKRELAKGEEHKKLTLEDGTVSIRWKQIRRK